MIGDSNRPAADTCPTAAAVTKAEGLTTTTKPTTLNDFNYPASRLGIGELPGLSQELRFLHCYARIIRNGTIPRDKPFPL